jgi:hypothetical protein
MSDAALPLRKAVLDVLKADAGVQALVSDRVFTYPTSTATKPYISIGPIQSQPDEAAEYDGSITSIQVDAWGNGPEHTEIMKVGRAIERALNRVSLTLIDDQRLVEITRDNVGTQYLAEEGGLTVHAAVTFSASTEPTA